MSLFIKTDDVTSDRRDVGPHGQLWAAAWAVTVSPPIDQSFSSVLWPEKSQLFSRKLG